MASSLSKKFKIVLFLFMFWCLSPTTITSLSYPVDSPADWSGEDEYWEYQSKWAKHGRVVVFIDYSTNKKWFYNDRGEKCKF